MTASAERLKSLVTSLPSRLVVLALGVVLFSFFGVTILANVINPRTWLDFAMTLYIASAGVLAFVFFFSKQLWQLLIVGSVAAYFAIAFLLWPPS